MDRDALVRDDEAFHALLVEHCRNERLKGFLRILRAQIAQIRLSSGELRMVRQECMATIGAVSNPDNSNQNFGKAGRSRWMGIRPTVRGVAMNPIDHPHGGGEGRTSGGRHPVTPWGKGTKGNKTRKPKQSDKLIVRSRHAKKKGR